MSEKLYRAYYELEYVNCKNEKRVSVKNAIDIFNLNIDIDFNDIHSIVQPMLGEGVFEFVIKATALVSDKEVVSKSIGIIDWDKVVS